MVDQPATAERAVCGVILTLEDGRVLLQQRDDKPSIPYSGWWTFFGGSVEAGETPEQAIHRELMEELAHDQPLTFWYDYVCPIRTQPDLITRNYMYAARLSVPLERLRLLEGQAMRAFSEAETRDLQLAYAQSTVLRAFFTSTLFRGGDRG